MVAHVRFSQSPAAGGALTRGPPAPGARSPVAHFAVAAAAPQSLDSVRPDRGRSPPAGLANAALRAAADTGRGARGDCRGPDPGEGGAAGAGARRGTPSIPSDGRISREPEIGAGRGLQLPQWVGSGGPLGFGLPAGGSLVAAGGMLNSPDLAGRLQPGASRVTGPFLCSTSPPSPRSVLGLGVRPRVGRPAGRYSAGDGGMLRSPDLAGRLGPGATLAAAFFPIIPATLNRVD